MQAAILSPWNLFAFLIAFLLMLAAAILLFCGPAKRKSPAAYRVTNPSFEALLVWSGNNRRLLSVLLLDLFGICSGDGFRPAELGTGPGEPAL